MSLLHQGVDECDGLPHKDKDQHELIRNKEHLIIPPISSAAGVLEVALEKKDSKANILSSATEQTPKKAVKTRRKGTRNRQRPRSYVGSNSSNLNSTLNMELSKKLAILKQVKSRSDSDPLAHLDLGKELME